MAEMAAAQASTPALMHAALSSTKDEHNTGAGS